ncbi:MAG: hypothetical protein M1816_006237 [Peltula sp. TS41687]|nr:MAG: hypothetical protein M1816_006237 [Peltula sp. TS41687]
MATIKMQENGDMTAKETYNPTQNGTAHRRPDYGGNPLAHVASTDSARLPAFGGEIQPGLYRPIENRKFGNPAPLGLSAVAVTLFILSLICLHTKGVHSPNIVVAGAFAYGGFVQVLAGMWEYAIGNTFGGTAFASYGGFWLSYAITLTPGGFEIVSTLQEGGKAQFAYSFGFFLMAWFILTFLLLLCTLRSTVAMFLLFFFLDLTYLLLGVGYLQADSNGAPQEAAIKAGGVFGLLTAFFSWYNALAGLLDSSNSFFVIPVVHFPWSEKGREQKAITKTERATV